MRFVQVKVKNGKLLQLEKTREGYRITGDFFCHPEDAITGMEGALARADKEGVKRIFADSEVVGFGCDDLFSLYEQL